MEGKNFIFIHNPKTAGTSIYEALKAEMINRKQEHKPAFMVKGDKFKFGVCRDPFNWIGSYYSYVQKHDYHHDHNIKDFSDYLITFCGRVQREDFIGEKMYYTTQTKWLEGCDMVLRYENLQQDFDRLCYLLGLDNMELPKKNVSAGKEDYMYLYSQQDKELVINTFQEDFKHFNYDASR